MAQTSTIGMKDAVRMEQVNATVSTTVFGYDLSNPINVTCPRCSKKIKTKVENSPGPCTYISCVLCCLFGCTCGCCIIPYCINACNDREHYCPECDQLIGTHRNCCKCCGEEQLNDN